MAAMVAVPPTRRQSLALLAGGLALPGLARAAEAGAGSLPEAQFTPDDGSTDLMGMEDTSRRMTAPVV